MTLEEAILHCEEVAREEIVKGNLLGNYSGSFYTGNKDKCERCASEHRQLAEWLNELKRARILLEATHNLLVKQMESGYVLNLLSETVFYDEAECDGHCLMEDIENLLEYHV